MNKRLRSWPRKWGVVLVMLTTGLLGGCSSGGGRVAVGHLFRHAVVAADHELASRAGARVLAEGGNAVDAAVATSLALSVVRPYSCGLGGGGFMVIALKGEHGDVLTAIDYRETCPRAVGENYYIDDDRRSSTRGGTAVAVPGTVAGLMYAHEKYGRLSREKIVEPAIELAEQGFKADAHYAAAARELIEQFQKNPDWQRRFPLVWNRYLKAGAIEQGELIRVPEQAEALRLISAQGRDAFYQGDIARNIVHEVRKDGGDLTLEDLRTYYPREFTPVEATVAGYRFVGMPPPSSGGVTMLEALRIMESAGYDFTTADPNAANLHIMIESIKHAFADRAEWFGDPAFVDVPIKRLLSDDYTRSLAQKIDPQHTRPPSAYGSRVPPPADHGTSHFSVVDAEGNAVACTETINLEFGSLVGVDRFGFVLNDEMDDFLTRPGEPNAFGLLQSTRNLPAPGKRPLSSMSPTLVFDDQGLFATAGASGGPRIITSTMQVLLRAIAGQSATQADAAPRLHHQWMPNQVDLEPGALAPDLRQALESRGHIFSERSEIGDVQIIRRDAKGWDAASDPRKGGKPAGY